MNPAVIFAVLALVLIVVLISFILVIRSKDEEKRDVPRQRDEDLWVDSNNHYFVSQQRRLEMEARVKEYFRAHRPKLFYNTISEVTVVLNPSELRWVEERTAQMRLDGLWESEKALAPYRGVVVCTQKGDHLMMANYPDQRKAGTFIYSCLTRGQNPSELKEFVEKYSVDLIHDKRIFVPLVSEGLIGFPEQVKMLGWHHAELLSLRCIRKQLPPELR